MPDSVYTAAPDEKGQFINACNACGSCQEVCPFLRSHGTPNVIIAERPAEAFLCTNCGACRTACPAVLDPPRALWETKRRLIRAGALPARVEKSLCSARTFSQAGRRFPFLFYPSTSVVFWPGCGLAGTSPSLVEKLRKRLEEKLGRKVGIALDCCYDPVYQIGDGDTAMEAAGRIRKRLQKRKIERIITGCANCRKIFSIYLPDVYVDFALDLLCDDLILDDLPRDMLLHHPCSTRNFEESQAHIEAAVGSCLPDDGNTSTVACCGHGGGLSVLSKDLSDRFTRRIAEQAGGREILTYCTGCIHRFRGAGDRAFHLLTHLPGVSRSIQPVSTPRRWLNRFFLGMKQRIKGDRLFVGLLIGALIGLGMFLRQKGVFSSEVLLSLLREYPVAAPLLFMMLYAVAPSLFLPSIPLTLAAGFLWGPVWGIAFSMTGATAGACVSFFLSRYLVGDTVRKKFNPAQWQWLEGQVERHGWKAVAFVRLFPVFPFNVLNYLFGLTPIPFRHYLWSTFVFMVPACIVFTAFGSSLGELILEGNLRGVLLGIAIAVIALLLSFAINSYFLKMKEDNEGHE